MKLLVVAPCNGEDVGEAWVGYQWVRHLAELHDVTLLTYRKRTAASAAAQLPGVTVVEWLEPPLLGRAERLNSMLKPAYFPFLRRCRQWIRAAHARGESFDIAFQPLPVAMRYPSPLVGMGIPFVIGPVGGSLESPPGFAQDDTAPWYVNLRRLDSFRVAHDPWLRRTYASADCVVGIAAYAGTFLSSVRMRRFETMSETAIEALPPTVDRSDRPAVPVRLLFVGRLIRTKGARDAIRAMASLGDLPVHLDVVGDGFDATDCRRLVAELDLAERVTFHGTKSRTEVDAFYRDADVFVFPSYREPGGNVAFEAMSFSLPLVVVARGGPETATDDSCAIRVVADHPEQLARDVAASIRTLVEDPDRRLRMGAAGRARVAEIATWPRKAEEMTRLFNSVLSSPDGADRGRFL